MDQCPELGCSTSEAQAWHPARARRPCQPRGPRPQFMCFPSLCQLLPPRLALFRFDIYFPYRVGGRGQYRGCQWAAAPLHLHPHPTLGLPSPFQSWGGVHKESPITGQTHRPVKEGAKYIFDPLLSLFSF